MKKRILLADDEEAVRKVTRARLLHEGYEVVTACDGEEVLRIVESSGFLDLILLDLKMPKLDGFQVLITLKEKKETATIPIVLFTASSTKWEALAKRSIEMGAAACLAKPFRSSDLLACVKRISERKK